MKRAKTVLRVYQVKILTIKARNLVSAKNHTFLHAHVAKRVFTTLALEENLSSLKLISTNRGIALDVSFYLTTESQNSINFHNANYVLLNLALSMTSLTTHTAM